MHALEGRKMSDVAAAHAQSVAQAHAQGVTDVVTTAAQAATYGGAGAAIVGSQMSLPDWAAVVSMCVAVLGFLLQVWLAVRKTRHEAFIEVKASEMVDAQNALNDAQSGVENTGT